MRPELTAYYSTVAQVLPVLALVLLLEVRAFGDWPAWWRKGGRPEDAREISPVAALVALFYGALFLFGELAALNILKEGRVSSFRENVVSMALVLYLVMMFIYPMQMHAEALLERTPLGRLRVTLWAWRDKRKAAKERGSENGGP